MPNKEQYKFHTCQKCRKIVKKTYQNGYCLACLQEHFASLRQVINSSHALNFAQNGSKKEQQAKALKTQKADKTE